MDKRMTRPPHDEPQVRERLKEMMLYVSGLCMQDHNFGATKLCKILYFADFTSYAMYGTSITGAKYRSLPKGPVPISLHDLRDEMVESQELAIRKEKVVSHERHRFVPLRDANLDEFSGRDIAIINQINRLLSGHNATQVSDLSHGIAWRVYTDAEFIPMESIFLLDEPVTEHDVRRAQELIREHSWHDV